MDKILGIGNALVDVLATLTTDDVLTQHALPKGSMQHVNEETSQLLWNELQTIGCQLVAGGSAANTINGLAKLGVACGFIGKIGNDTLGDFFFNDQQTNNIHPQLQRNELATGRAMVFISPNKQRTFAVHLGAAIELTADDLQPDQFDGYRYLHIEGYLVQNYPLVERAVTLAKQHGLKISLDMASYNVVEQNKPFLNRILTDYVDVVFANEEEAHAFTGLQPEEALAQFAKICPIAVVKTGASGSLIRQNDTVIHIPAVGDVVTDTTGAGDLYASGFLYGLLKGMPLDKAGNIASLCAGEVVAVIGPKIADNVWDTIQHKIGQF